MTKEEGMDGKSGHEEYSTEDEDKGTNMSHLCACSY